jgi:heterodisulfide reductase subunit A
MEKRVVVIGGGITGLTASLSAAELGEKVLIVESSSSIGGMLERLDTWFVDDACGMCQILPQLATDEGLDRCLRRDFYHPLIEVKTLTEVVNLDETDEGMVLTLKRKPRYVDEVKCTGCALCEEVCPEQGPDPFDKGLTNHKAIHTLYSGSLTKTYCIDMSICTKCKKCVELCPTKAIDLDDEETQEKVIATSIILSAGFSEIDPSNLTSFGYGRFKNVLTSLDFERLISRTGKYPEVIKRPSDDKQPSNVALIQCVGSRDKDREYCSSSCCMYAIKEARKIKEISKDIDISIFYMDIRTFGKGHYRYYLQAKEKGVKFKNYRIPAVEENADGSLQVKYEENDKMITENYDMVILSTGQEIKENTKKLLETIGIKKDKYGFSIGKDFETFKTTKENVYVAGSLNGPKDIEASVIEARSVGFLASGNESSNKIKKEEVTLDIDYRIPKFGIFFCQGGGIISDNLDIEKVKESLTSESEIAFIDKVDFVCQENRLDDIMKKVKDSGITRIIFATCSPSKYEMLIRDKVESYGFNQAMVEILRLRENVIWAYDRNREDITIQRIKALMEKLRLAVPIQNVISKGLGTAVVIGGGVAGMVAALNLTKKGVKVIIVEKEKKVGGNAQRLSTTLEGEDVKAYLKKIMEDIDKNENITTKIESEIVSLKGGAGNFTVGVKTKDSQEEVNCGAVIVATGANEYKPTEYSYGSDQNVITQIELEEKMQDSSFSVSDLRCVVMIQCVGSRNDEHPWCSKVCCSDAIKNSLTLKEKNKDLNIFILYRDIMTYGRKELEYEKAREKGITFIKFEEDKEPVVSVDDGKVKVMVEDTVLKQKLEYQPDLLVLSTGIVPRDNESLSKILGVSLGEDGFFKGANPKFRPLESEKTGIFFAGMCRSPSGLRDAVAEATAAAGSAYIFLREIPLMQRRTTSDVIERWCSGCEFCVEACPFDARYLDEEKKIVKVRELNCVGCGNCVSACPNGAAKLKGMIDRQIIGMIDASL